MLDDSTLTLVGRVGGDVRLRRAGDAPVAGFRLACTPRRWSAEHGAWIDGETQWYSVNAWRALGEHCARSVRRGDPVVVVGRLRQRTWTTEEGVEKTSVEVEAATVAHDLRWGTTTFQRRPRTGDAPAAAAPEPAEPGAAAGAAA